MLASYGDEVHLFYKRHPWFHLRLHGFIKIYNDNWGGGITLPMGKPFAQRSKTTFIIFKVN